MIYVANAGVLPTELGGQSWAQLIDFVSRQGDWLFDKENDALCQADGGECM